MKEKCHVDYALNAQDDKTGRYVDQPISRSTCFHTLSSIAGHTLYNTWDEMITKISKFCSIYVTIFVPKKKQKIENKSVILIRFSFFSCMFDMICSVNISEMQSQQQWIRYFSSNRCK